MNLSEVTERKGALKALKSNLAWYRGAIVSIVQTGTRYDLKVKSDDGTGTSTFEVVAEAVPEATRLMAAGKPAMVKVEQFAKELTGAGSIPEKRIVVEVTDARTLAKAVAPAKKTTKKPAEA